MKFNSKTLGREYHYYIYLPAEYDTSSIRYPVFYLLHGRGDNMAGWAVIAKDLDRLIATGELPAFLAVMPDFPSNNKAGYYIDSEYTGKDYPAEKVETAFFNDLIPEVDRTFRTLADRNSRVVAGYSMGGYGAIRYLLAHPDIFMGGIVLSPAVYTPLPPTGSSTREFGAFGKGNTLFDETVYQAKNYPALFASFSAAKLKTYLYIASGDDEYANPIPVEAMHDIDMEAHLLYTRARRVDYLSAELRIVNGAHAWDVWRPTFIEGARYLAKYLATQR